MAIRQDNRSLLVDNLIENIYAIEKCISFRKESCSDWEYGDKGILGIPAFILICSVIDTIGSYFRDTNQKIKIDNSELEIRTASDHFFILNHETLFKFELTKKAIADFYESYRSKIVHNNSLPANNFLGIGDNEKKCFEFDNKGLIQTVYLKPLFDKTTDAVGQFLYYLIHSNFSDDHKLTKELIKKAKQKKYKDRSNKDESFDTMTGHTN